MALVIASIFGLIGGFITSKLIGINSSSKNISITGITGGILLYLVATLVLEIDDFASSISSMDMESIISSFLGGSVCTIPLKFFSKKSNDKKFLVGNFSSRSKINESSNSTSRKFRVINLKETGITYESDGTETRTIDNSRGNGIVRRKIIITREWKKAISYSNNKASYQKNSIGIDSYIISLRTSLDKTLSHKYELSQSETKVFSEEVEIEVLPHSIIILKIEWKKIWQNGTIELIDNHGQTFHESYRIAKGLTFDQIQEKIN